MTKVILGEGECRGGRGAGQGLQENIPHRKWARVVNMVLFSFFSDWLGIWSANLELFLVPVCRSIPSAQYATTQPWPCWFLFTCLFGFNLCTLAAHFCGCAMLPCACDPGKDRRGGIGSEAKQLGTNKRSYAGSPPQHSACRQGDLYPHPRGVQENVVPSPLRVGGRTPPEVSGSRGV